MNQKTSLDIDWAKTKKPPRLSTEMFFTAADVYGMQDVFNALHTGLI